MHPGLVAFDFDGTLATAEMIVLLAAEHGNEDEVRTVTERAMAGEIDYATSLRERVAHLSGLSTEGATQAFNQITLTDGAAETIETLRQADIPVAILTGGFRRGVSIALENAGISVDRLIANELVISDGQLTGDVTGPLIEGTKDTALQEYATAVGCDLAATVAVGDGANDIPMLAVAGLAIGYRPKPAVRQHCDVEVDSISAVLDHLSL